MMTPIVNGIRKEYGRELNFVYVCLEEERGRDLARQYGIQGYPVVLLLDSEGNRVNVIRGVVAPVVLENAIGDLLAAE